MRISRTLPVLTSCPAACQKPWEHTPYKAWPGLQVKIPAYGLCLDLGGTAETLQNP